MKDLDEILLETEDKMSKAVEFMNQQFAGLRTGKASVGMVDGLAVSYYGTTVRLRELANISTPDPRLIVINAYDLSALPAIEKAILAANLGVTPLNDGRVIRVPIPELSGERRMELAKVAKQMAEKARVAARSIRQEANEQIKEIFKQNKISEDEREKGLKDVQQYTDNTIETMNNALAAKEKEILAI